MRMPPVQKRRHRNSKLLVSSRSLPSSAASIRPSALTCDEAFDYAYLRQFEQAKSDVQQAMRLSTRDPALSQWHYFTADAEIGLGNFDTAIDECNKAIDGGDRVFYT